MKIETIEIKGFGKLKNRNIQVSKGINVIFGNNEAGKSTLQEFIKAMFFSPRSIKNSDYIKKYEPWNCDFFGGNLSYVLDDGRNYRIERDFKNQTMKLYDDFFNDISSNFEITRESGSQFAKTHMGVGEEIFEKTVFIRQMETRLSYSSRKTLFESLIDYAQTGTSGLAVEDILFELNKVLKIHIGNNRTKLKPLEQVVRDLDELGIAKLNLITKRDQIQAKILKSVGEEKLEKLRVSKSLYRKGFELATRKKEIETINEKIEMTEQYYHKLQKVDEENIRTKQAQGNLAQSFLMQYEKLKVELDEKLIKLGEIDVLLENGKLFKKMAEEYDVGIRENCDKVETLSEQNKYIKAIGDNFDVIVPSGIALILYILCELFDFSQIISVSCLIFTIIYPIVRMIIKNKTIFADNIESVGLLDKFKKLGVKDYGEYLKKLEEYEFQINEFELLSEEICCLEEKIEVAEKNKNSLITINNVDFQSIVPDKSQIEELKKELTKKEVSFENSLSVFIMEGKMQESEESKNAQIKNEDYYLNKLDEIDELIKEEIVRQKDIEILAKDLDELDKELFKINEEIEEKEKIRAKYEDVNFAINSAIINLQEAGEDIKRRFLPKMTEDFEKIVAKLTKNNYKKVNIDDKHDIKIVEENVQRIIDAGMLSGGSVEQIYFALRISMANSLTINNGKLPLILDEIFAYYDDERMENAIEYLGELSQERQILLFTCKKREIEIARKVLGNKVNCFELTEV